MKRYKIAGFGLLFALHTACNDKLDVQPVQSISTEVALSTPENIQNLLTGAYSRNGAGEIYGGLRQLFADLHGFSDQATWTGTYTQPRDIYNKAILTDNSMVRDSWMFSYEVINMTNIVIDHVGIVENEEDRARILGEAKFLRALNYFDLVRLFGAQYEPGQENTQLGVPLSLTGILDYSGDLTIARNTVEEVYAQVIADLNDAYGSLPESNGYFADRYAARALLARVYLQQGNYEAARDAANDVIENSGRSLAPSYSAAFNNDANSSEDIFAIQVTSQDGDNDLVIHYAHQAYGGRGGDVTVNDEYVEKFDSSTDVRASFFYTSSHNNGRLTSKYTNQFGNIPLIRLAEMYLIRAEANMRLGTAVGATPVADINEIRDRANASLKSGVTLEDILLERELELGFEGFLIHDLKRTNRNVGDLPYDDNRLVFPIPQRETDANDKLVQNPGYL